MNFTDSAATIWREFKSHLSATTIKSFFAFDILRDINVFNVVYTLWLFRFLYWTHTSLFYYLFAGSLWAISRFLYPQYFSYVWYFFLFQVLFTLWKTMLDQYYVKRVVEFEGLECEGTEVTPTHLQPAKMNFNGRTYEGKENFMKLSGAVLRHAGWGAATNDRKKHLAYAFCHQHLLSHSKIGDDSGFTGENASFSVFNPFSPVFIPSSVKNYWFSEGIEVKGWTCYKRISRHGFVTFFRAYHQILFNAKGEITSWEVVRFF
jgi:hypothetical protein